MVQQLDEEAIFGVARKIDSAEARGHYLDQVCGADAALRGRVQALLGVHDGDQCFLQAPAAVLSAALGATLEAPVSERPGTTIGPYKLLEQIGEGGFGIVFMAEQSQPVRRRVALKVLKPGMDTRQVVARFEAERQALALMDHPNIARVFDGGETTAGRPYFVMELVRGVPITEFCDATHMPVRERLELFLTVCQAVQHAHQKAIIHRDLKPSNIMVTLYDGTPVVKVIDFGIAKALGQQLTDKTLFTNFAHMIGTPIYMSPEQAEMSGLDMDTRSDIYSIGVLLYELLTGTTPCDKDRLKTAAIDEIRRMIREDEPATPSTRITTLGAAATLVSANRKSDPRKLSQQVRGDLDWIVMKALEKDRNRRYESASAFAADVQRFLNDEQVLACPPSLSYRLRRGIRRQRGPLTVAALVLLVLVGGIVGTTWGLIRATGAYEKAIGETTLKETALKDKEAALKDAENQLFRALVNQANAEFRSRRVGQRFETLKAIRQAAKIRMTPELRTLATAALILPDAALDYEWDAISETVGSRDQVGFNDDFDRYARMEKKGNLLICRRQDRREEIIHRLRVDGTPPQSVVRLSRDGRFVAYGHSSTRPGVCEAVRVWKLSPQPVVLTLEEPTDLHMWALAFNPKSDQLAIGHADGKISVFELPTGRRLHRLLHDAGAGMVTYHPRESWLAAATFDGVHLFDTKAGKELPGPPQRGGFSAAAWHPDGRRLAFAGNRKIFLWDIEEGAQTMPGWTGHTSDGISLAFNHAGDRLLSNDWSNRVRFWDVATGRLLLAMPGTFGDRFSPDDQLLGPGGKDGRFEIYRVASGREFRVLRRRQADESLENITAPVIAADGRTLAACATNWLTFFDLESGEELASIRQPRPSAFTPVHFEFPREGQPGAWLTAGSSGLFRWPVQIDAGRPDVLRVGPPEELAKGLGHRYARGASVSADGNVVAVPCDNITTVLHRDQPEKRLDLGPQNDVRFSAVSPDGRWVFAGGHWPEPRSKNARVWDANTGKQITELPVGGSTPGKFSSDGRWLVTMGDSGCHLWEVGSWREVRHFQATHAAFSPDSRLLAVNDVFGVIRLVETATGREVARLTGPESHWYYPTSFTPDGTKLIAGWSGETALCVWDLRLIRQQLKEMDLDWEWDEFVPAEPMTRIRRVEIDGGEFAGTEKN